MAKLTARDRRLLYLLALGLFAFAAVYWAVLPAARNFAEYKAKYDVTAARREQIDAALNHTTALQADIDRLTSRLEALESGLMTFSNQSEVDMHITGLIQSFGLSPVSLTVAPPTQRAFDSYDSEAARDRLFGESDTLSTDNAVTAMVWKIDAVFSGSVADFNSLADSLAPRSGLYIQSFSYTVPQGGGAYTFSVTFMGVSAS